MSLSREAFLINHSIDGFSYPTEIPYLIIIRRASVFPVLHFLFVYLKSFNELSFCSSLPLFLESGCKGTAFPQTCKQCTTLFFKKFSNLLISRCVTTILQDNIFSDGLCVVGMDIPYYIIITRTVTGHTRGQAIDKDTKRGQKGRL